LALANLESGILEEDSLSKVRKKKRKKKKKKKAIQRSTGDCTTGLVDGEVKIPNETVDKEIFLSLLVTCIMGTEDSQFGRSPVSNGVVAIGVSHTRKPLTERNAKE
jgi:hypothetical protein